MVDDPACSLLCVSDLGLAEGLSMIAEAGFTSADVVVVPGFVDPIGMRDTGGAGVTALAAQLAAARIEVSALVTYLWVPDAVDDAAELDRRRAIAAEMLVALEPRCWVVDAGTPLGSSSVRQAIARWTGAVEAHLEIADRHGVAVAVEAPHLGTLAERERDAAALVREAPQRLGRALDTFHLLRVGDDPVHAVAAAGARLRHVAFGVAGGPAAAPIDATSEFVRPVLAAIDALDHGHTVALAVEHVPPPAGTARAERVRQLDAARRALVDGR